MEFSIFINSYLQCIRLEACYWLALVFLRNKFIKIVIYDGIDFNSSKTLKSDFFSSYKFYFIFTVPHLI